MGLLNTYILHIWPSQERLTCIHAYFWPSTTISTNNKKPWRSKFSWRCLSGRLSLIFIFGEIRFYSQRYFNPLPHKANNVNTLFPNLLFDRARRSIRKLLSECNQRYTYRVLQTIQMKLILLCVWAEPAVLGSTNTALKFNYEICIG